MNIKETEVTYWKELDTTKSGDIKITDNNIRLWIENNEDIKNHVSMIQDSDKYIMMYDSCELSKIEYDALVTRYDSRCKSDIGISSVNKIKSELMNWCFLNKFSVKEEEDTVTVEENDLAYFRSIMPDQKVDKNGDFVCFLPTALNVKNWLNYRYPNIKYNLYTHVQELDGERIDDFIYDTIQNKLEEETYIRKQDVFRSAFNEILYNNRYNPCIDYLESLQWDEIPRVETLFIDWLGVEDTAMHRRMTKLWFIAAVKRIIEPGCKFDNVIILQGGQGIGKTLMIKRLAGEFGNSNDINIDDVKQCVEIMNNSWIINFDEMSGLNKKDMNKLKSFLGRESDTCRLAYDRFAQTYKRHCIFISNTNDEYFLRDYSDSAERRFWVLRCLSTDKTKVFNFFNQEEVNNIWAEAYKLYKEDPDQTLYLGNDMLDEFIKEQNEFKTYHEDEKFDFLNDILNKEYCVEVDGIFKSSDEFIDAALGRSVYYNKNKAKINVIPASWIKMLMKKIGYSNSKHKYLLNGLDGEWIMVQHKAYNTKCYVRKEYYDNTMKHNETNLFDDAEQ